MGFFAFSLQRADGVEPVSRRTVVPDPPFAARLAGIPAAVAGSLFLTACASSGGLFGSTDKNALTRPPPTEGATFTGRTVSNSSIAVLVNDQPITKYDVDQRTKLIQLGGGGGSRKGATEELISETLQMIEARRRRVEVSDGQVDRAYASIGTQLKLTPSQFDAALRERGVNPNSLKRRLRAQIAWRTLVERRTRAESQISSADLTSALLARGDPESITLTEYSLQQIIFVVPSGSSDSAFTQRRREANRFRQRFQGCQTSLEQARQLKAVVVKDIGRRSSDQLTGPQGEEIGNTAAGSTTTPSRTGQGIELFAVCAAREVQSTAAARTEIQNKYALEQADDLGKDYLEELREAAIIQYR